MSLVGTVLRNRYKIIEKLGNFGFSNTYLAEDKDFNNEPVAVKQLQSKDLNPDVFRYVLKLFEREQKVLHQQKKNEQISELRAYFEEDGEYYLVQEFVDGHDLRKEIILGERWSEEKTVKLLREVLEILAVVHKNGIIHRDIKPSNIMRRKKDEKLVLIDFGAVKQINSSRQRSLIFPIVTPGYTPQEQYLGQPELSSDIYALGMMAIQALTGIPPNNLQKDNNDNEMKWRENISVSNGLAEILTKMVSQDHRKRYFSAKEAKEALDKLHRQKGNEFILISLIIGALLMSGALLLLSANLLFSPGKKSCSEMKYPLPEECRF